MPTTPRWIRPSILAAFAVGVSLLVLSSSPEAQVLYVTDTEVSQDGQVIMHLEPIECEACNPRYRISAERASFCEVCGDRRAFAYRFD